MRSLHRTDRRRPNVFLRNLTAVVVTLRADVCGVLVDVLSEGHVSRLSYAACNTALALATKASQASWALSPRLSMSALSLVRMIALVSSSTMLA